VTVRELVDRMRWEQRGGLWVPGAGFTAFEDNISDTAANAGTTVTASGSTHTVGNTTQLIASTAFDAYRIMVLLGGVGVSGAGPTMLVNIRIGANGSETTFIPNLDASNSGTFDTVDTAPHVYSFPLFIPAGSRISANCQASTASDTVVVGVILFGKPKMPQWAGRKVTAYGADTSNSRGTSHTAGASSYATGTQLSASTSDPIRAMQIARDGLSSTGLANIDLHVRIGFGAGPTYVVSGLLCGETNREFTQFNVANSMLALMSFDIPAGLALLVSGVGAATARGYIVYGVS
jgi:hypothetical protein